MKIADKKSYVDCSNSGIIGRERFIYLGQENMLIIPAYNVSMHSDNGIREILGECYLVYKNVSYCKISSRAYSSQEDGKNIISKSHKKNERSVISDTEFEYQKLNYHEGLNFIWGKFYYSSYKIISDSYDIFYVQKFQDVDGVRQNRDYFENKNGTDFFYDFDKSYNFYEKFK
jgi:hypothetical protein